MKFFPIDFDSISRITDREELRAAKEECRDISECIRDLKQQILCEQYDCPEEPEEIRNEIRSLVAERSKLFHLIREAVILE